jgi:hypothetical protein
LKSKGSTDPAVLVVRVLSNLVVGKKAQADQLIANASVEARANGAVVVASRMLTNPGAFLPLPSPPDVDDDIFSSDEDSSSSSSDSPDDDYGSNASNLVDIHGDLDDSDEEDADSGVGNGNNHEGPGDAGDDVLPPLLPPPPQVEALPPLQDLPPVAPPVPPPQQQLESLPPLQEPPPVPPLSQPAVVVQRAAAGAQSSKAQMIRLVETEEPIEFLLSLPKSHL